METSALDSDTLPPRAAESRSNRPARTLRPRRAAVSLSVGKRSLWLGALAGAAALCASFALGFVAGRGSAPAVSAEEAALPERSLVPPVPVAREEEQRPQVAAAPALPAAAPPRPAPPPVEAPQKIEIHRQPPDGRWFGVQIGAFPDAEEAERLVSANAAALAKLSVYVSAVQIKDRGTWHRVRVGTFKSKAEAEAARRKLPAALVASSMVVSYR